MLRRTLSFAVAAMIFITLAQVSTAKTTNAPSTTESVVVNRLQMCPTNFSLSV